METHTHTLLTRHGRKMIKCLIRFEVCWENMSVFICLQRHCRAAALLDLLTCVTESVSACVMWWCPVSAIQFHINHLQILLDLTRHQITSTLQHVRMILKKQVEVRWFPPNVQFHHYLIISQFSVFIKNCYCDQQEMIQLVQYIKNLYKVYSLKALSITYLKQQNLLNSRQNAPCLWKLWPQNEAGWKETSSKKRRKEIQRWNKEKLKEGKKGTEEMLGERKN